MAPKKLILDGESAWKNVIDERSEDWGALI